MARGKSLKCFYTSRGGMAGQCGRCSKQPHITSQVVVPQPSPLLPSPSTQQNHLNQPATTSHLNSSQQTTPSAEKVGSQQPVPSSQVAGSDQPPANSQMYNPRGIRHLTVNGDTFHPHDAAGM